VLFCFGESPLRRRPQSHLREGRHTRGRILGARASLRLAASACVAGRCTCAEGIWPPRRTLPAGTLIADDKSASVYKFCPPRRKTAKCPCWRLPCKSVVKRKREVLRRAPESAHCTNLNLALRTYASRLMIPASLQNQTSICGLKLPGAVTED